MTPLYAGIGGVVRELTEMYTGVGGVVRPMTEMWAGVDGVNRQIFSSGTPAGSLGIGDVVQINETGVAQDYLCVHQGLPSSLYDDSCNGTWLLRKDIIENQVWQSDGGYAYASSDINTWLNNTMFGKYDQNIKEGIKQVKIPYCVGNGSETVQSGANGLVCKVFLLSGYEENYVPTSGFFPKDGDTLSYFSGTTTTDSKRIAYLNGQAWNWWSRNTNTLGSYHVMYTTTFGNLGNLGPTANYGARPCIILPKDFVL